MPVVNEELVTFTRSNGNTINLRKSKIDAVLKCIETHPGLTPHDISMMTKVIPHHINLILQQHPRGQDFARRGLVAKNRKGPDPLWLELIEDVSVLPEPPANALTLTPETAIAKLPETITSALAIAEGEAARKGLAEMARYSGGLSPKRAQRANTIINVNITHMAHSIQEREARLEELQEHTQMLMKENASAGDVIQLLEKQLENLKNQFVITEAQLKHFKSQQPREPDMEGAE